MPQGPPPVEQKNAIYKPLTRVAQGLRYSSANVAGAETMLRITENAENEKIIRIRLDGTVNSASYAVLETTCARHREAVEKIILVDMAGVVFMDNEAASRLAGIRSNQV